jgi:predicted transcriptional regulator
MITPTQREILLALINIYEKKKEAVKGEDISKALKRNAGTIRNQMQTLKAIGYVEGIPGPKGGYYPSTNAYEALSMQQINKPHIVNVFRDGQPIEGLTVQKIEFNKIQHPTDCTSVVTVVGDTRKVREHDVIKVGPTPVHHLVLTGEVVGRDDTRKELLIASHGITSIPKGKVIDVATKNLITLAPQMKIRDCAKILVEKRISAAPVIENGKLVGILTDGEIVKAVAQNQTEGIAQDILLPNPITIDKSAKIIEAMQKMQQNDVGRLLVIDTGKPVAIITKTDIIKRMLG